MELRRILWPAAGVVITMLVLVLPASVPASGQAPEIVAAHTSGRISTRDSIRVRFVPEMDAAPIDRPLAANPFRFEPGIDGQALWRDARTLIFRPHKPLPPGRAYRATLDLAALAAPGEAAAFSFDFATLRQSFDIRIGRLQAASGSDMKRLHLPGEIRTADVAAAAQVMQLLTAQQAGQGRNISWTHTDQGRTHRFLVKNILRGKGASALVLQWDGTSIGAQQKGTSRVEIPPLGPFQALDARAIRGRTQYIDLHFSDPLQKDQDLGGLIRIDGHRGLRFTVEGNGVRVYSERPWSGEITLRIATGVRNALGQRLVGPKDFTLNFAPEKPQVRFMGKGVIIPTSQGLTLPVETVNLRALTVEALRVNEQNLPQFLQVNNLDGERQLRRVGRVVWKQTLPLEVTAENADQWVRHGLDLTPLVKAHPHGLYRLRLTFQRPHIIYPCAGDPALPPAATEAQGPGSQNQPATTSYWDGWDEGFDRRNWYRERHNPCHPAYYQDWHDRNFEAARNVLVSDMGLTAKQGADDQLLVVATDLKSARPLEKVKIRLFNYQQEEIAQGSTGRDGMARIGYEMAPFLVVAEKNGQTGYLRLDNGAALSVSHFDVAGQEVEAGIKGFLYAERGVWRPGDPIYLTFILRDDSGRLPTDHPVVFELRNPRGQLVHRLTRSQSLNGFFTFPTRTAADAPTGNWNVRVRVGGASFEKTLKIETVRPNRLKIGLDFGPHTTALSGGRLQGKLSAAWLHGAVAKHLKADIEVAFSTRPTRFAGYEEYAFDDPARTYNPESQTIFEGTLDAKGQTLFTAEVATENLSPGMLTAQFNTRVFEPGGAFSIDRYSLPYHPYARYVGLRLPKGDQARGMLLTDTDHIVRLAAL
ncbi:MAG: MG2 domain-containing protein, partial [Desulfobacterales bacterium]